MQPFGPLDSSAYSRGTLWLNKAKNFDLEKNGDDGETSFKYSFKLCKNIARLTGVTGLTGVLIFANIDKSNVAMKELSLRLSTFNYI